MTRPTATLTITIPPQFWLTQNRAIPNHHARRARVNAIHELTAMAARNQQLATIPTPCKATWTIQYPKGTGPADPVNASPTTKACLDALVPVWLARDDSKHVVSETFQRGPNLDVSKSHVVTLELTTTQEDQ